MSTRWRLNPRRTDWIRTLRCVITGHEWQTNSRGNQSVCHRCFTVDDHGPHRATRPSGEVGA